MRTMGIFFSFLYKNINFSTVLGFRQFLFFVDRISPAFYNALSLLRLRL